MLIRDITPNDKSQVLRLVELFYKERLEKQGVHYSAEHASIHFDVFIAMPGIIALCLEDEGEIVGLIAGVTSAILFAKELALQEMVWYVESRRRKYGVRLLKAFEQRAVEKGIQFVTMMGMTGDPVLGFYPRVGYVQTQETFMKQVG